MRIAIIGAGLAGLTAAYEIHKADPSAHVDVFEAADRIGGKLYTVPFNDGPTDMGAEAFLARRSDAVEFFTELGLADSLVEPSGMPSSIYSGGAVHSMPRGGVMGIPSESAGLEEIISPETAARIDAESTQPSITWTPGQDYSVGQLVRERYGDEVVDRVVSALLGGVYSCNADDLGIRATVPQLAMALDALANAGEPVTLSGAVKSVVDSRPHPVVGEEKAAAVFNTFRGGYAEAYEALAEKSGADIHIDSFIAGIEAHKKGGFTVKGGGEAAQQPYDRVLVATPAPTTARLLSQVAPDAAAALKPVKLASSAVVGFHFASSTDPEGNSLPANSGILIASDEPDLQTKAFTLSSNKWPHVAERLGGGALVRASFGRFGDDAITRAEEDDLVDYALDDLQKITGFDGRAAGVSEIFTQRWFGGLPRFDATHLDTVAATRAALEPVAGVEVAGAWAAGVGVPNIIADTKLAVARLLA